MNVKLLNKLLKIAKILAIILPLIGVAISLASGSTVDPTGSSGKPGGDPIEGDPVPC
jgi:hypothetical protein